MDRRSTARAFDAIVPHSRSDYGPAFSLELQATILPQNDGVSHLSRTDENIRPAQGIGTGVGSAVGAPVGAVVGVTVGGAEVAVVSATRAVEPQAASRTSCSVMIRVKRTVRVFTAQLPLVLSTSLHWAPGLGCHLACGAGIRADALLGSLR
jgi:hypothetical protein